MKKIVLVVAAAFLVLACRTTVIPHPKQDEEMVYKGNNECKVRDYENATDVPSGAKNLGWVTVPPEATDEQTYEALHKKICEMGGNATSSLHWEMSSTETTAQRLDLQADAWALP